MLCHVLHAMDCAEWDFTWYLVVEPLADGLAGEALGRQLPHLGVLRVTLLWHTGLHLVLQRPIVISRQ